MFSFLFSVRCVCVVFVKVFLFLLVFVLGFSSVLE